MLTATPAETNRPPARRRLPRWVGQLNEAARRPVSADSTAAFRIGFGLLVAASSFRFLAKGWVDALYLTPNQHLTYPGFDWVRPLPSLWMHFLVASLGFLGLAIAVGYRHRLATGLFIVGFVYTELIEASLYLNHYWFMTATAILLLLLPVNHWWALDARSGRVDNMSTIPHVVVWILQAQLAAVYVFAGIAKLNSDWLFRAEPLSLWFSDRTHVPLIGSLLGLSEVAFVAAWGGAIFDLTIIGWLLCRRTRLAAYATLVLFHLFTGALFQIGVFPYVMIVSTLIFFSPDWPRRFLPRPFLSRKREESARSAQIVATGTPKIGRGATTVLGLFALLQLVLPLRHYTAPGNVRWNEDGYYLAWRVMLTDKAGTFDFAVTDPATGVTWEVGPELVLTDWQANHAAARPDLVHATALLVSEHYENEGIPEVQVRANAWVSMNGQPVAQLLGSEIDLAAHKRGELPTEAVLVYRQ